MIETEDVVARLVERDPLRHAGIVHDLIFDRERGSRRALDPHLLKRHGRTISMTMEEIGEEIMRAEVLVPVPKSIPAPVLSRSRAQNAIALIIEHTHAKMIEMGIASSEDRPALAVARAMFAAALAEENRDAIRAAHPGVVEDYEIRAKAA